MAPFTAAIAFLALGSSVLAGNPRFERRAVTGTASVGTGVSHSKSTVYAAKYPMTNGTIPIAGPTGTVVPPVFTSPTTSVPVDVTTPATSLVVPATSAAVDTASGSTSIADAAAGTQMTDGQVNIGAAASAPTNSPASQMTDGQITIAGAAAAAATTAAATSATSAPALVGAAGAAAADTCPPCPSVVLSCPAVSSAPATTVTITETGPAAVTFKEMVTFTVTASLSGTEFIPTATATGRTLTSVLASKKANTVPPYPLISSFVTVGPTGTGVGTAVGTGTVVRAASGAPLASGTGGSR